MTGGLGELTLDLVVFLPALARYCYHNAPGRLGKSFLDQILRTLECYSLYWTKLLYTLHWVYTLTLSRMAA